MEAKHNLSQMLGKPVHIVVDRPTGYQHRDIVYPINYGYVPGMIAADGEEQDAYILGVQEPICEFDGNIIGLIRRKDDAEDKLVAAPDGMLFHQAQIAEAVHFQEQFFTTSVECLLRRSCGVIPFRTCNRKTEFLVLLQKNGSRSFPKGHMEPFETEEETAFRETLEETGLQAHLMTDKQVLLRYRISSLVTKEVLLFAGNVTGEPVLQEKEISSYQWANVDTLETLLHPDTFTACEKLLKSL